MARQTKMTIGAINIKIHPHTPQTYIELFNDVIKLKRRASLRGDIYGHLSSFSFLNRDETLGFKGFIYKYLNIDPNEPWFDVDEEKVVDKEQMLQVEVLKKVKPHFSHFMYLFIPKYHRFFFTTYYDKKSISPSSVERFLKGVFYHPDILEKYGEVDVIVEPSIDGLEKIFKIPTLERLELLITKPNPDDHDEAEQKLLQRLGRLKAKRLKEEYVAESRSSIEPDDELRTLSRIAASNGYVWASGKDLEGKAVQESTTEHPYEEPVWYASDENPDRIFVAGAQGMMETIKR